MGLALSAPEGFEGVTESIIYEPTLIITHDCRRENGPEVEPYLWFTVSFSTLRLVTDLTVRPFQADGLHCSLGFWQVNYLLTQNEIPEYLQAS